MDEAPVQDRASIERAVAAHERALVGYVAHLLGRAEPARDVVQEAFARLCEQTRDVPLPEWLFAVCRNLAIDRLRRDRRTRERPMSTIEIEEKPNDVRPDDAMSRGDEHRQAVALLGKLPPRQQEAIRLKFQGDLSYPQIAGVMKTNENNVAVLIHLGLRRLREQMQ